MPKQITQAPPPSSSLPGGYVSGRVPTPTDTAIRLPSFGDRARPFRLSHHSTSWELFQTPEGWRIIPVLSRLTLRPGVNWTTGEGSKLDASDLEAKARSRWGQRVLTDWTQYIRLVDGANDSTGYFLAWEKLRIYEDGAWESKTDEAGYALWRWSLVTSGVLAPPRDSIISQIRNRLQKTLRRSTRTPHLLHAQEARAKAERRLEGLQEALAALADLDVITRAGILPPVEAPPRDDLEDLKAELRAELGEVAALKAELAQLKAEAAAEAAKKPARKGPRRSTTKKESEDDG